MNLAAAVGRAAGDDLPDHAVAVVLDAQHGADADEGELHLDAEILQGVGGEIVGMRVVHPGERSQEDLLDILALDVAEILEHALVALAHRGLGVIGRFLGEEILEDFILHPAPPQVVGLGLVGREGALAPVGRVGILGGEIVVRLEFLEQP